MYWGLKKIEFEMSPDSSTDARAMKSLLTKIKAKFPLVPRSLPPQRDSGKIGFVAAGLFSGEQDADKTFDRLSEFVEEDFGRIESESTVYESVDYMFDEMDELSDGV